MIPSLSSRSLLATALLAGAIDVAGATSAPDTRVADSNGIVRCGVENIPAPELAKLEKDFRNQRVMLNEGSGGGLNDTVMIDLYMHVIATNETLEGGNVPDSQITSQVDVLNTDYQSMNIGFNLVNVTRTINKAWFHAEPNSKEQTEMKRGLRQGGPADLNVYSNHLGHKLLGYATFPKDVVSNLADDGVVVLYTSLPGGGEGRYDGGRTLTHEVGHWLGLYHTFQGGCEEPGDLVDDTPSEAYPGFGCPDGRKSCPQSTGLDPVHNFMDYGDDSCMESFTPGQGMRAKAQIAIYRGIKGGQQGPNSGGQVDGKHHHRSTRRRTH